MALRPTRPQTREEQLAARNAAQQDAFLREVDDALREDEMVVAIKRYGKPVGAAVLAGLAALGGWLWWSNHTAELTARRAEQLTVALDQLDGATPGAADPALAQLAGGEQATATLARLLQAGQAQKAGKTADAVKLYETVAADETAPKPYRDLATLRAVALDYARLTPDQVVAKVRPLAVPGDAWFGLAGELLGAAYLAQGHKDLAGPLYVAMAKDANLPDTLKARARQAAGVLGYDAIDDVAKPAEPGATAAGALAAPAPAPAGAANAAAAGGAAPAGPAAPAQP